MSEHDSPKWPLPNLHHFLIKKKITREREKKEREEVSYHNSLSMCKEGMLLMKVGGRCSSLPERVYLR